MTPTGELRAWSCHKSGDYYFIAGDIFNDIKGRWPNGSTITTSAIISINIFEEEDRPYALVVTRNSIYKIYRNQSLQSLLGEEGWGLITGIV